MLTVTLVVSKGQFGSAITGLDMLKNDLRDMRSIKNQLDSHLDERRSALVDATPVGQEPTKDGDRMRDSWGIDSSVANYEYVGRIFNTSPHAAFVIEGTGIYGPSDKGSGQMIEAKGQHPFVFRKEGKKMVMWRHKGQPGNVQLNQIIGEHGEITIRAAERVLRGLIETAFQSQISPGIISEGRGA